MSDLLYDKFPDDHYAIFTMNRPDRLNAISSSMTEAIHEALDDFVADDEMRVGIVTGTGRAFSAGADLKEMAERGARNAEFQAKLERGEITEKEFKKETTYVPPRGGMIRNSFPFTHCPKPLIAAVNGLAHGGGMERSLECDIRIASTAAEFATPEVKRGILAGYAIHHLSRLIPFGEVMYLLATGESIGAEEAKRIGLVHDVVEPDQLMPTAIALAKKIAGNAPLAVQASKSVAHYWRHFNIDESLRYGEWASKTLRNTEDAKEGPRAFAEKRPPVWKGR